MPAVGIASPSFWHFLAFFWDEIHPARSGVPYPALQEEVPELGGDGAGQEGPSGGVCAVYPSSFSGSTVTEQTALFCQ